MIPRFDAKAKGWRGADGRFMKLGVPLGGWVLVRCEACGQAFPTVAWHPSEKGPDRFFCTERCRTSGRVAELITEAERDADMVRRYQEGQSLAVIREAHRISIGTLYRILHSHGVKSNRSGR